MSDSEHDSGESCTSGTGDSPPPPKDDDYEKGSFVVSDDAEESDADNAESESESESEPVIRAVPQVSNGRALRDRNALKKPTDLYLASQGAAIAKILDKADKAEIVRLAKSALEKTHPEGIKDLAEWKAFRKLKDLEDLEAKMNEFRELAGLPKFEEDDGGDSIPSEQEAAPSWGPASEEEADAEEADVGKKRASASASALRNSKKQKV